MGCCGVLSQCQRLLIRSFLSRTGFRLQSKKCLTVVDQWKRLQHSNVVQLKEVFTTKGFGDQCMCKRVNLHCEHCVIYRWNFDIIPAALVLVYDYHPGSQTLLSKYFTPTNETNGYTDPFQGDARPFRLIFSFYFSVYQFIHWLTLSKPSTVTNPICKEYRTDHCYKKRRSGPLSCNWQPVIFHCAFYPRKLTFSIANILFCFKVFVQSIKPVLPAVRLIQRKLSSPANAFASVSWAYPISCTSIRIKRTKWVLRPIINRCIFAVDRNRFLFVGLLTIFVFYTGGSYITW